MALVGSHNDSWRQELRDAKNAREAIIKDEMIARLKQNGALSDEQMDLFKHEIVSYDDERRSQQLDSSPHQSLRDTRHRQHEINEKFEKMSLHFFIDGVVKYIENHAPSHRYIRVYEDVVSLLPSDSDWRRPASNTASKYEIPDTPFSVSRAEPKSNAELIDTLVSAVNLKGSTAVHIRGIFTWFDSMTEEGNGGMWNPGSGLVSGGRLGRDHMLSDAPNHFVRDSLMNYIVTQLDEDKREDAKKAVFTDLSATDIEEYCAIITQKQTEIELKEQAEWEESRQAVRRKEAAKAGQTANLERLESIINEIDKTIDVTTPRSNLSLRSDYNVSPITGSVITPGLERPGYNGAAPMDPEERDIDVSGELIDRDCDQIRAMIAIFLTQSEWSGDQFRWALGHHITRPQLNTFLEKKGSSAGMAGKQSTVFPLAWEFFKRREMIGLSLVNTEDDSDVEVLQEHDGNRRKRRSTGESGQTREKRTRRT